MSFTRDTTTNKELTLHAALIEHFSHDELKLLCRDAGVDPETVPYSERGKDIYTFCMIGAFRRKGLLPKLLSVCAKQRPAVNWSACPVETTVPVEWTELFTPQNLINTQGGAALIGEFYIISEETMYSVIGLPNPYIGLRAFTYDDQDAYAGRQRAVEEAVMHLTTPGQENTFLFITGASGCGKSSFAQAGLLPAIERHYAIRGVVVRKAVFRPGTRPKAMLDDAFRQSASQTGQIDIIIIDQFEELFTQSLPDEQAALISWLTSLPSFCDSHTHLIATLRSDYLKEVFDTKILWDIAKQNSIELRAMTVDELKDAIQRPLQARYPDGKKCFEPALLDKLAYEASASPTLLPLLQVTLDELWKKGKLVLSNYGTLTDAIKERADQILKYRDYDSSNPRQPRSNAEQTEVINTFLDFVNVATDEDFRQTSVRRNISFLQPDRRDLVNDLIRARLLSVISIGDQEEVCIIHESLITNWNRLKNAIGEERVRLQLRARFEESLREWRTNNKSDEYLLIGIWLAQAQDLDKQKDVALQSADAKDFFQRSLNYEAYEKNKELRRKRRVLAAISALIFIGLLISAAALVLALNLQQLEGESLRKQADTYAQSCQVDDALRLYTQAQMKSVPLDLVSIEASLRRKCATQFVQEGEALAHAKDIEGANQKYRAALDLDPPPDVGVYVWVPDAEFTMGSDADSFNAIVQSLNYQSIDEFLEKNPNYLDEMPTTTVQINGFWIQRTEVTYGQYKHCIEAHECDPPDNSRWNIDEFANQPVTDITWDQAKIYAIWKGGRLPTEAEWELACRSSDGRIYPWGNEYPGATRANFSGANLWTWRDVGSFPKGASPYGILDLSGSVWEWTSSLARDYPYDFEDGRENPISDSDRVLRGGAYYNDANSIRCTTRFSDSPDAMRKVDKGILGSGGIRIIAPGY